MTISIVAVFDPKDSPRLFKSLIAFSFPSFFAPSFQDKFLVVLVYLDILQPLFGGHGFPSGVSVMRQEWILPLPKLCG